MALINTGGINVGEGLPAQPSTAVPPLTPQTGATPGVFSPSPTRNREEAFGLINTGGINVGDAPDAGVGIDPAIQTEVDKLEALRSQLQPIFDESLDPAAFERRREILGTEQATRLRNRFANLGLGGSAVEIGSVQSGVQGLNMQLQQQRLKEAIAAGSFGLNISQTQIQSILGSQQIKQADINSQRKLEANLAMAEAQSEAAKLGAGAGLLGTGAGLLAGGGGFGGGGGGSNFGTDTINF